MSNCLNARLVFIRCACLLVALSYVIFSCAASAGAQTTSSYNNVPFSQGQVQGYAPQTTSQALPGDWPQTLSVPGMENVIGLAQGDNNLSYSVRVISQDGDKVNFQVSAFCVSNPQSEYAMLHVLDKPLMGVVDPEKKTLQIDFSPLASSPGSVEIIDKADIDKVLLQETDSLVLHTVMSVQSMDASQVKFSISDMSLLQPDGVLDEFSLPGPVPAVFDPATARFSTVAFDEMTNVLQQNIVNIQQNTYINVVNIVNQVNVINVVDFGGFGGYGGYGGYGPGFGIPYGGYGDYGGYGGYGDYGGYGGYGGYGDYGGYGGYGGAPYGGFMPWSDPLPLAPPQPAPPLGIPDDVPIYDAKPVMQPDGGVPAKLPLKERAPRHAAGDMGERSRDISTAKLPDTNIMTPANPEIAGVTGIRAPRTKAVQDSVKAPINTASPKGPATKTTSRTPIKQSTTPATAAVKTPEKAPTVKSTAPSAKTTSAKTNAPGSKPALKAASQSVPAKTTVADTGINSASKPGQATRLAPASKTSVTKAPAGKSISKSAPATKSVTTPKTNEAKSAKAPQVAKAPAQTASANKNTAPKANVAKAPQAAAKAPAQTASVKKTTAPKANVAKAPQAAPKAVSNAKPAASGKTQVKGGGRK